MTPKDALPPKEPDEYCNGRNKAHTKYCDNVAGKGTSHKGVGRCWLHGGAEPHAEANGQVVLARREAIAMGLPRPMAAGQGIIECIEIAAGERDYATERIAALDEADAVGPVISTVNRPRKLEKGAEAKRDRVTEVHKGAPDVHVWIRVRHDAMDRLVRYEVAALRAGIEERRVKLAESQGQLLVQVIRGVLSKLGVIDRPEVPSIVREQLTLAAGQTEVLPAA